MEKEFIEIQKIISVKEGVLNIPKELARITEPTQAVKVFKTYLENADREYMACICLNTKNDIVNISTVSMGSLNCSIVHPREVFKIAIASNSASIILAHNHPSGDVAPSQDDRNITERIKECGSILGIELLDHIIVSDNNVYYSFKEQDK